MLRASEALRSSREAVRRRGEHATQNIRRLFSRSENVGLPENTHESEIDSDRLAETLPQLLFLGPPVPYSAGSHRDEEEAKGFTSEREENQNASPALACVIEGEDNMGIEPEEPPKTLPRSKSRFRGLQLPRLPKLRSGSKSMTQCDQSLHQKQLQQSSQSLIEMPRMDKSSHEESRGCDSQAVAGGASGGAAAQAIKAEDPQKGPQQAREQDSPHVQAVSELGGRP